MIFGSGLKTFRIESHKNEFSLLPGGFGGGNHPHQLHFELLSELRNYWLLTHYFKFIINFD